LSQADLGTPEEHAARRRRAMRTALVLGLVAVAVYLGFIAISVMRGTP
jgi:hypothetical protein